jgi:hypothetical protein
MVHARYSTTEVVRYNRAGKWYVEREGRPRAHVTLAQAVWVAESLRERGGVIFRGVPGGRMFDFKLGGA